MKAVIVKEPGGLEQLRVVAVPDPSVGRDEVLIDVAFCGLNWADTVIRVGTYPHPFTYPAIPGLEAAGRIGAIEQDVGNLKVGDRVVGFNEKGAGVPRNLWRLRIG